MLLRHKCTKLFDNGVLLRDINSVGFEVEVLTEMLLKIHIFWGVKLRDFTSAVFIKI